MKLITVDMEKPLTMKKLEALLSNSQIKAQFFNLGYGVFRAYSKAYKEYGNFYDPSDPSGKRYNDFKEADEDVRYINNKNGGKALLRYWFETNKDYVDRKLLGRFYNRVKYLEGMLVDNKLLQEFVYSELVVEFLANLSSEESFKNYSFKDFNDGRERILPAYIEALESVYKLYIQKSLN
ncbi:hypothetical protein M1494_00730 [Candidatus Parvarchaeota archaeon]|nr:hypothetical protein [Candidatus Parvarchaeota archaeon]